MKKHTPPKLFLHFFRWFCHPDLRAYVEGDLMELYQERRAKWGKRSADMRFASDVLLLLRPGIVRPFKGYGTLYNTVMIGNYIKIAWRNILKSKGYSLLNIVGLAVGMTTAMLIGLWIHFEITYNSFYENIDRIGVIRKHSFFNDKKGTQLTVPLPLYHELKETYSEVKRISRFSGYPMGLKVNDRKVRKTGHYVDPDFIEMFSFTMLRGNAKTALNDPKSIVLTESLATTLFGDKDPMGKVVSIENEYDAKVTGIMKDIPYNSSFHKTQFLSPFEYRLANSYLQRYKDNWGSNVIWIFLELGEGVFHDGFSDKIAAVNLEKDPITRDQKLSVQAFDKFHLYDKYENWENVGGKITYVKMFGIIGALVLLIACINFMNLSTARSGKRAREVGIRKSVGSRRIHLITQFFSESVLNAFIAYLISVSLVFLCIPHLSELGFENVKFDLGNISLWIAGLVICLVTGLAAGSYPALYLSSFQPVNTLKGRKGKGHVVFRRLLVVTQFAISTGLIICTLVVFHQINHVKNRSVGYNPDNLISIVGSTDIARNFVALKQELLNTGYITAVAKTSGPMTDVFNSWSDFSWDGKDPDSQIALEALMTEWDYEKAAGLKFIQGRPFSPEFSGDSNAVILNATALEVIGYEDPIGRTMKSGGREITIVGVVEDVLMKDPFKPISPGVILFNASVVNRILIRIKPLAALKETLASVEQVFEKYNPSFPFEYSFVDEDYNKKFALENQIGKLAGLFAGLAIFISCLGLFGLASYVAEQRTKEIGIRKTLGASVLSLWQLLSKDFVLLAIISSFIAIPFAYLFMQNWLLKYDYRTEIPAWLFATVAAGVLVITLLTVSYQTIKAALMNPVNSLRSE